MPSSYVDSIPPIMHEIISLNPRSVCDVGPGWGKYGLMCREYLPSAVVDAVEVSYTREQDPAVARVQDLVYGFVRVDDVRDVNPSHWEQYDLVLMIDMIEHLEVREGQQIVREIISAGARLIVSTPKQWFSQDDDPNPYEHHKSLWTWKMLPPAVKDLSTIDSLIFLLGDGR